MVADCNPIASVVSYSPEQVMLVGIFYRNFNDIARLQRSWNIAQKDISVDFRRIGLAARGGTDTAVLIRIPDLVDNHWQRSADLRGEFCSADRGGLLHDALIALFLDLFGHWIWQRIGGGWVLT